VTLAKVSGPVAYLDQPTFIYVTSFLLLYSVGQGGTRTCFFLTGGRFPKEGFAIFPMLAFSYVFCPLTYMSTRRFLFSTALRSNFLILTANCYS
jgi:hypothetical protein